MPPTFVDTPETRNEYTKYLAEITFFDAQCADILDLLDKNDPHCLNNLIDDQEYANLKVELSDQLDAWMKSQGDNGAATEALARTRQSGYKDNKRPTP